MYIPPSPYPRRDPLTEVVDYDSLRVAATMRFRKVPQWQDGSHPIRPIGHVRFELLRQLAVFAVPLAIVAIAQTFVPTPSRYVLWGLAFIIGLLLDAQLEHALERSRRRESSGQWCYDRFRELCYRLNLKPSELTCARINKLCNDYMKVFSQFELEWAQRLGRNLTFSEARRLRTDGMTIVTGTAHAKKRLAELQATEVRAARETLAAGNASTGRTFGAAAAAAVASDYDEHDYAGTQINPATGLPMIDDSPLDVAGNVYGTESASFGTDYGSDFGSTDYGSTDFGSSDFGSSFD